MSTATEHRLPGLEPDNLLAFLALLGLMRALEAARPEWRPRVRWDVDHPPTRPVLALEQDATADAVAEAAAAGCDALATDYDFDGRKGLDWSRDEAHELLRQAVEAGPAGRNRAAVLAALVSDIAAKDDGTVLPTPLCLMFGQGHQHFLERFSSVARQACAPARGTKRKPVTPTPAETIAEALFRTWERIDPSPSFRWDPAEDRRYALRFRDPQEEKTLTVHGANRLAVIGLPLLTVVPVVTRGRVRLSMIAGRHSPKGEFQVSWPIWTRAMSLDGIRALLTHPQLRQESPDGARLHAAGVREVRRATRISVGKFLNFTRAEAIPMV